MDLCYLSVTTNVSEIESLLWQGVLVCDQVCQWLTEGQWFSLNTTVSSTNETDSSNVK
jgi:hypothetical protein